MHDFTVPEKDPAAVPEARRLLLSVVSAWQLPLAADTLHDLELLSGEAIANAVLHTSEPCSVRVRWTGTLLRVEVTDATPGQPTQPDQEPYAESGRGLLLIASLAANWGCARTAAGKTIWFEVTPADPATGRTS
ncbi:ATP-binding protein [Streptomyces durbertensis]|uniref:ATP-binding protein n=1 Tax=Streptomyces durbertensis TaxID=2448886 RepID=A0ABR6EEN1_9ACTN|nr:ATP-binding protein [Streptomyces durbertensis]MBB1243791.1 ATP-binding protein [Streptomyces durbertensis]